MQNYGFWLNKAKLHEKAFSPGENFCPEFASRRRKNATDGPLYQGVTAYPRAYGIGRKFSQKSSAYWIFRKTLIMNYGFGCHRGAKGALLSLFSTVLFRLKHFFPGREVLQELHLISEQGAYDGIHPVREHKILYSENHVVA